MKTASMFYPERLSANIRRNVERFSWAADIQARIVKDAQFWLELSDDELWALQFGNTIKRSWMVLSGGFCPSCKRDVTMYNWVMDGQQHPWKAKCPHCGDLYPKNDFAKYYRSGLDEAGIFQPEAADRSLLFNVDHPDPLDPLHKFGVDDGDGYVDPESGQRWRFIGTYLIYGHWKQLIVGGIEKLSSAYIATGNPVYARKAGILLDRVADLYPTFDFGEQGIMYEKKGHSGYVSTWHDANMETFAMVLGYDKVFDAIKRDSQLVDFLAKKAKNIGLSNEKRTFADIQANIEERIFRDALANRPKITFNFPATDTLQIMLRTVLEWREAKADIMEHMDSTIEKAVAVDGVTGEKGLANYTALTINKFAEFLSLYDRVDPDFMTSAFEKHPSLKQTWRFHIDTWCMEKYYPLSGDSGAFALPVDIYRGVMFENSKLIHSVARNARPDSVDPSMYSFMWSLYRHTGDTDYIRIMYRSNNQTTVGLPYDMTADEPESMQAEIERIIAREGAQLQQRSLNKEQWHLAILRSGEGDRRRALWLDYDSGFAHGHRDGMNLGLFAKGLDLMPECGYPPVQWGEGWQGPKVKWYTGTASHNTVVVDGERQPAGVAGMTTLWADGEACKLIRTSGPELIAGKQYERTVTLTDISQADSYVVDIFRVVGGKDHAKFQHSHFGKMTTAGLTLSAAEDYGYETLMRNFQGDANAAPGWVADWEIEDEYGLLPEGGPGVHLRYTDLTIGAQAYTAQGWVNAGGTNVKKEKWIPRVMVRRQTDEESLASTFVSVIEPYEGSSSISAIRRLDLRGAGGEQLGDNDVAVEILLADGRRDLHLFLDAEDPLGLRSGLIAAEQQEWGVELHGEYAFIRMNGDAVERVLIGGAQSVKIRDTHIKLKSRAEFVELAPVEGKWTAISGNTDLVEPV